MIIYCCEIVENRRHCSSCYQDDEAGYNIGETEMVIQLNDMTNVEVLIKSCCNCSNEKFSEVLIKDIVEDRLNAAKSD